MRFRVAWGVLALLAVGCGSRSETSASKPPSPPKAAPADPWVLTCLDPNAGEPALLWNGLIGIRIGRDGTGVGMDGKPLPFFAIDEYERTGEEKILTLPNPLAVRISANGAPLSIDLAKPYRQALDMRNGVLTTAYDAVGKGGLVVAVKEEAVMHPSSRQIGVRWSFTPNQEGTLQVEPVPGLPTQRRGRLMYGEMNATFRHSSSLPQSLYGATDSQVLLNLKPGKTETVERTCEFSGTGEIPPLGQPQSGTFAEILAVSDKIWRRRWKTDIEIEGPVEDQQAVRSFLFYLRSAIHPNGGMSISPFGLSNEQYGGHVFWDADVWVFPALAFVDPDSAKAIVEYRGRRYKAAQENYKSWLSAGRPTGTKPMGPYKGDPNEWPGAMFPWESSVTGHETVPGPSRFEHHITGSVYHTISLARMLGLESSDVDTMITTRGATTFYMARSEKGTDGLRDIRGTMSPDENHIGDNDLYTNLLAQEVTDDGLWKVPVSERPKFRLPKDGKTFLSYDNDPLRGYKQAAAVLSIYPLQYPPAEKQARAMMDRFADKVIKNGPAMTDSIHALIWARLGEREKAYETWQKSWKPFTTSPLMLFSEKRLRPTTYFTTGAAGSLQTVLFGFLGFRIDYDKEPGAAWATPLKGDSWLSIKPNLPSNWKSVKFKNFTVLGRRYTLTATPSAARLTPGE